MLIVLTLCCVVPTNIVFAQSVNLDVEPSSILENSQVLSLTGLGIDAEGNGPSLISATIENLTGEKIDNLYLELIISAAKVGTIAEVTQSSSRPFSLSPFQTLYFSNNDLANERIPGISTPVTFSGGLTTEGDNFLSNLSGSTSLPRDVYSLEVILFRVTDARGRENLARDVAEIGGGDSGALSFDESEIYLKSPGDVAGSLAEITNPYPQFSWEGNTGVTYRLLVVEQTGQDSPESLLQSAKSSSPIGEGGSLLSFENLDVIVEGTSFQFPASGAQSLEAGKTYYWRILKTVQSSGDSEDVSSEIWSFTLKDASKVTATLPVSQEAEQAIVELIGQEAYQSLKNRGFTLESLSYDGQEFTGTAAGIKLDELLQKIRDEDIIVAGN
ncbi:MAG: hypothetical protein CL670_02975 [Balneola sp.]|nr:hypothetical protein [Balneola sp.]MBE78096.1 hypothetical protein [Balneola sp.]